MQSILIATQTPAHNAKPRGKMRLRVLLTLKSGLLSSGHPIVANGNRPLENHVSSTSASCSRVTSDSGTPKSAAALARASASERATIQWDPEDGSALGCPRMTAK